MHACCALSAGHELPPCCAAVVTVRARVCEPPPHVCVQAVHSLNEVTTQCTGHACALHWPISDRLGHSCPPSAVGVSMARTRRREPPPHVAVHMDQPPHSLTVQSTGHGSGLQAVVCVKAGHVFPA